MRDHVNPAVSPPGVVFIKGNYLLVSRKLLVLERLDRCQYVFLSRAQDKGVTVRKISIPVGRALEPNLAFGRIQWLVCRDECGPDGGLVAVLVNLLTMTEMNPPAWAEAAKGTEAAAAVAAPVSSAWRLVNLIMKFSPLIERRMSDWLCLIRFALRPFDAAGSAAFPDPAVLN